PPSANPKTNELSSQGDTINTTNSRSPSASRKNVESSNSRPPSANPKTDDLTSHEYTIKATPTTSVNPSSANQMNHLSIIQQQ
ncbi:unnamed protein product, partial [Rotaria sordida]